MRERNQVTWATVAIFAAYVAAVSYAAIVIMGAGGVVWSDFVHANPHRSQSNALFIICITTPLVAVYLDIVGLSLPALTAGVCAMLAKRTCGRVSAWLLPAIAVACTIMLRLQVYLVNPLFDVSAEYGPAPQRPAPSFFHLAANHVLLAAFYFVPLAWAWKKTRAMGASVGIDAGSTG